MIVDVLSRNWWTEEDFTFEGVPGTLFKWPNDRLVCFGESAQSGFIIPTVSLQQYPYPWNNLHSQMQATIKDSISLIQGTGHLHVIKVLGTDDVYGMMMSAKRMSPITDFHNPHQETKGSTIIV